ncbi:MAG: ATP synthase F1 subunit delta [Phycisphaerae bacterium]|nr:ATP synthase F1 subunit delta [Phycisphaerae bacterium]
MTGDFDTIQAASKVYAQALLDLAGPAGQEQAVDDELRSLHELFTSNAEFAAFLCSPAIDRDQRRETLRKLFGVRLSATVMSLLLVLNDKTRLSILAYVCDMYRRMLERKRGEARVYVTTAVPLTGAQRTKLIEMVTKSTQWRPILCETVEEGVLGGLRVQLGDREIDRTVVSRLRSLRNELLTNVDTEIQSGRAFVTEN